MPSRPSATSRATRNIVLLGATAAAAIGAALAPAGLTGHPVVDAVERAVIAATCTFVGAHGRRWTWIFAAGLVAVPARGTALLLVLAALAVLVPAVTPRRRSKDVGAIGIGLLANVPFWYGPGSLPWAPLFALAAYALLIGSGRPFLRRHRRRALAVGFTAAVLFVVLAGLAVVASILLARTAVTRGASEAQAALQAARAGNAERATLSVSQAAEEFAEAGDRVDSWALAPASLVPGLAQQVHAVQAGVHEGRHIADTADDLVRTADYDRLTYAGRIDLAQVRDLTPPTRRTSAVLDDAADRLDGVRGGWLLPPLQHRLDDFADQVAEARRDTALTADILHVTPALFGGDGPRRYLVVFITPAELRGAGGFIGSYAELTAIDGKVRLTRSGRIMELIQAARPGMRRITGPADYLRRYGRFNPQDFLQDVTFSPDFPSDAQVLDQLYPQSGGADVDGVISVDPRGLAALLKLTGPIKVRGLDQPLRAANAEEVLLRSQYVQLPDEAERGEILTEATRVTFERLTEGSLPAPRRIADALSGPTRQGHLHLWSPAEAEQALFERLGADGSLRLPVGDDGFSVVQQNVGNNKLDAYLHRSITYAATVDARSGDLRARMDIELRNEVPGLALPAAVVGNSRGAPPGTNVATLSILTRQNLVRATLDGKEVDLGSGRELGLNSYDTPILRIPAGGTVHLVVELAGGVDLTEGYDLRILPQPVANADRMSATLRVEHGSIRGGGSRATLVEDGPLEAATDRRIVVVR